MGLISRVSSRTYRMDTEEVRNRRRPKSELRADYINKLRDWQWECHLHACKTSNFEARTTQLRDNLVQLAAVTAAQSVITRQTAVPQSATDVARAVIGNNNVVGRERETAGICRRITAVMIDWFICFCTMLTVIAIMYQYEMVALPALTKFYVKDMTKVMYNSMSTNVGGVDTLDLDKAVEQLVRIFESDSEALEDEIMVFTVCFKILVIMYETAFIWVFGFSIGKFIMGIEVIHYGGYAGGRDGVQDVMVINGQRMNIFRSFARAILKVLYFTILFPLLIFMQPFNARGNQFYDMMTKTMVVKRLRNVR